MASAGSSIGSSLGSILGGVLGANASAGAQGDAHNDAIMANNILQEIQSAPDISAPLILQKYAQQGILTPAMQQQITAQLPANITTNPAFQTAQMQALQQMQQRASTGFTQGDRAALQQGQLGAQGDTQSRLASIQQDMQQKGLSDSGSALAAKLAAAQQGANQESSNANQVAQMSQQAREQALGNLGQYSSQLQGNQFNQAFQQQQANQAMQRFNIQNQLGVNAANVGAQNQAQAANLANAQNVSNQNVNSQNNELNNQTQRSMEQYNANKNTAQIKAGGYAGLGNYSTGLAQGQAQAGYNLGAGLGGVVGSGASALAGGAGGGAAGSTDQVAWTGGQMPERLNMKQGGTVPGHAPVNGDSPANDIVKAVLSPGELVIPRTLSESKMGKHILKIIEAHKALKDHVNE